MCDQFSFNEMTIFINIALLKTFHILLEKRAITDFYRGTDREEHGFHTTSAQILYPLQTLFPRCKIAITSHCLFETRPIVDCQRGNEREEHGFHTIEAQIVYPLQTLFPSCKIAIFCHIVPLENSLYR